MKIPVQYGAAPGPYVLLAAAFLIILAISVSDGFFTIDEIIYYMGAEAVRSTHGFAVANGWEELHLEPLRLWFLVEGPGGLVPQYPAGSAVVGAPLIAALGQRGLIAMNVVAGIGTLSATHGLARRLFESTRVANVAVVLLVLCTFWVEYVVGHWPHSVIVFTTTTGLYLFLGALDRDARAWVPAFWAGLVVGAGMHFRVDGILVLPAIVAATILYARRIVPVLAGGLAGLAPMVALMSAVNVAKFGTLNPLSYGSSGGATDLRTYVAPGVAVLVCLAVLFLSRLAKDRRRLRAGPMILAGVPILAGLMFTPLAPALWKLLAAGHGLLIDATAIVDARAGIEPGPGGILTFWGMPKKALGQSLPWLGALGLLAGASWRRPARSLVILGIFVATWALPFIYRNWHGGLGANMRYFLPVLPGLCALGGWLIVGPEDQPAMPARTWAVTGAAGFGLSLAAALSVPGLVLQVHQILSTLVLGLIAALSLAAGLTGRGTILNGARLATGFGLGLASFLALSDFQITQSRRTTMARHSVEAAKIPVRVIFLNAPEGAAEAITNPDHYLAMPERWTLVEDPETFRPACEAGYRVLLPSFSGGGDLCAALKPGN